MVDLSRREALALGGASFLTSLILGSPAGAASGPDSKQDTKLSPRIK